MLWSAPMRASLFAVCTALALTVSAARGQVLFDAGGFESYAPGALPGQNGWTSDISSAHAIGAFGVGGSQGLRLTGGATNWFYPALNYTPAAGQIIVVECDIARTLFSATGSFGYAVDIYSPTGRFARFGLAASAGQVVPFVTSRFTAGNPDPGGTVSNVVVGGAVGQNVFVHFEARLNFTTQSFELLVNNVSLGNLPFTSAATSLADVDLQVSSASGQTDFGFFDNYRVTVVTAVPEPATVAGGLGALGLAGCAFVRRRRVS